MFADQSSLRDGHKHHHNAAPSSTAGNVYAKRNISTAAPLILSAVQQTTTGPAITQLGYDSQAYGTAPTIGNDTSQKAWVDLDSKWITSSQTCEQDHEGGQR